jgi:ankyrin repeat protein
MTPFRTLVLQHGFMALVFALAATAASVTAAQPPGVAAVAERDEANIKQALKDYFFDAARRGDVAMLKEFVAARYDLEMRDAKGYTALILATYHGHEDASRLLIESGANPCATDARGNTALMGAIFKGELTISRMLMKAGCDPNQRNNAGQTPAMYAALFGRIEVLKALAARGADLRASDAAGNSAQSLLSEGTNSTLPMQRPL